MHNVMFAEFVFLQTPHTNCQAQYCSRELVIWACFAARDLETLQSLILPELYCRPNNLRAVKLFVQS